MEFTQTSNSVNYFFVSNALERENTEVKYVISRLLMILRYGMTMDSLTTILLIVFSFVISLSFIVAGLVSIKRNDSKNI